MMIMLKNNLNHSFKPLVFVEKKQRKVGWNFVKLLLRKRSSFFTHVVKSSTDFVVILFSFVGKTFPPLAEKIIANNNNSFDEVLQKQFQPKTQKCEKIELFRRTDDETEQFFSFRSGEKPFLPVAKIFFDYIFSQQKKNTNLQEIL